MGEGTSGALTDPSWFSTRADALSGSINGVLWDEDSGYYRRAVGVDEWCGLGNAMAILSGVADEWRSAVVFSAIPWNGGLVPERSPTDPAMPEWRPNHSALWATQALWDWDANKERQDDIVGRIVASVLGFEDPLTWEGVDLRTSDSVISADPVVPAAAVLALVSRDVTGTRTDGTGQISATLPESAVGGEQFEVAVRKAREGPAPEVLLWASPTGKPKRIEGDRKEDGIARYRVTMPPKARRVCVGVAPGDVADAPPVWRAVQRVDPISVSVEPDDGVFLSALPARLGGSVRMEITAQSRSRDFLVNVRPVVPAGWEAKPAGSQESLRPGMGPMHDVIHLQATGTAFSGTDSLKLLVHANGEPMEFDYPLWRRDGIDLTGEWRFRIGDDPAWADPAVSDASWDTIRVPGWWEDQGFSDEGWAWYRKTVEIPEDWRGACSVITIGAVDDEDTLFINGKKAALGKGWETPRRHVIAPHMLLPGEPNLIAIRVKDYYGGGGISTGPVRWIAAPAFDSLPER